MDVRRVLVNQVNVNRVKAAAEAIRDAGNNQPNSMRYVYEVRQTLTDLLDAFQASFEELKGDDWNVCADDFESWVKAHIDLIGAFRKYQHTIEQGDQSVKNADPSVEPPNILTPQGRKLLSDQFAKRMEALIKPSKP